MALGAYLRKVSASATKKSAKRQLQPEDSNDATAPKTPGGHPDPDSKDRKCQLWHWQKARAKACAIECSAVLWL